MDSKSDLSLETGDGQPDGLSYLEGNINGKEKLLLRKLCDSNSHSNSHS